MNNQNQNSTPGSKEFSNPAQSTGTLENQATQASSTLVDSARSTLGTAGEKLSQGYDIAATELKAVGSQLEGVIKGNPLIAIGIAAGLGWVLGRVLTPRTDDRT